MSVYKRNATMRKVGSTGLGYLGEDVKDLLITDIINAYKEEGILILYSSASKKLIKDMLDDAYTCGYLRAMEKLKKEE